MNKWKILIPNLLVITAAPLINLVGCNNKKSEAKFSVAPTALKNDFAAEIELNWTDGHSIEFSPTSFHFFYNGQKEAIVETKGQPGDKPYKIELGFRELGLANEITDGVLTFDYTDNTTGTTTSGRVDGIKITIPWAVSFDHVQASEMLTTKTAGINVTWTNSESEPESQLSFQDLEFKYDGGGQSASVELGTSSIGSQLLNLSFTDDVLKTITDGTLSFKYKIGEHKTIYSGKLNNIIFNIPDPDPIDFSVATSEMTDETTAIIALTWTPAQQLIFDESSLKFTYGGEAQKVALVSSVGTPTDTSQSFKLTFSEKITAQDITDGVFNFTYIPDAEKGFKYKSDVKQIHINKLTFEKDTWKNICTYAEFGLDNLKAHYGENSFVGKTKNIEIDGFTYELQVIGQNEDYLADEEGKPTDTPAALTFMFKTVLQTKNEQSNEYEPYLINFVNEEEAFEEDFWTNSVPKKYLDNDFLPLLESSLDCEGAVKTVSKNTISNFALGDVSSTAEKIFLPSMADIFSSNEDNFQLPSVDDDITNKDAYIQEGRKIQDSEEEFHYARYSYFDEIVNDAYNKQHPELAVYDGKGRETTNEVSYWLRTCLPKKIAQYLPDRKEWVWCSSNSIWEEGRQKMIYFDIYKEKENLPDPDYIAGMAPIFCI